MASDGWAAIFWNGRRRNRAKASSTFKHIW
jgi:hypothetical protein